MDVDDQIDDAPVYGPSTMTNRLMDGHNVERMMEMPSASVDLIYMDPPYKSGRKYNQVIDRAHEEAYDDMYSWNESARSKFNELTLDYDSTDPLQKSVAIWLKSLELVLANNAGGGTLAYMVEMAPVLMQCRRLLKHTGSIYIHLDSTVVHYVKVLGDLVFGPQNFRAQIEWKRTTAHNDARGYGSIHDSILFFTKSDKFTWNGDAARHDHDPEYVESFYRHEDENGRRYARDNLSAAGLSGGGYTYEWGGVTRTWRCPVETMQRHHDEGRIYYPPRKPDGQPGVPRLKRYLDESNGIPLQDLWFDIAPVGPKSQENREFEGQKPLKLVERIILVSSNPGEHVLDPYLGSGTTGIAAGQNGRTFTGIELTPKSLAKARDAIAKVLGEDFFVESYGPPGDMEALQTLIARDKSGKVLQHWAVRMLHGTPSERMSNDGGRDGTFTIKGFVDGKSREGIIQVTGAKTPGAHFDKFVLRRSQYEEKNRAAGDDRTQPIGVYVCLPDAVTETMRIMAEEQGYYTSGFEDDPRRYPKLQIITFDQFFDRAKPAVERLRLPGYVPRPRHEGTTDKHGQAGYDHAQNALPQMDEDEDVPCNSTCGEFRCKREAGHSGNHQGPAGRIWGDDLVMLNEPPPTPIKSKKRA